MADSKLEIRPAANHAQCPSGEERFSSTLRNYAEVVQSLRTKYQSPFPRSLSELSDRIDRGLNPDAERVEIMLEREVVTQDLVASKFKAAEDAFRAHNLELGAEEFKAACNNAANVGVYICGDLFQKATEVIKQMPFDYKLELKDYLKSTMERIK